MATEAPRRLLASPCIGVCRLDMATSWCTGCGRELAEIGRWRDLASGERSAIWDLLPERLKRLGQAWVLQPWPPETINAELASYLATGDRRLLVRGNGGWVPGHLPVAVQPALRLFAGRDGCALALPHGRLPDVAAAASAGSLPPLPSGYRAIALVLSATSEAACQQGQGG